MFSRWKLFWCNSNREVLSSLCCILLIAFLIDLKRGKSANSQCSRLLLLHTAVVRWQKRNTLFLKQKSGRVIYLQDVNIEQVDHQILPNSCRKPPSEVILQECLSAVSLELNHLAGQIKADTEYEKGNSLPYSVQHLFLFYFLPEATTLLLPTANKISWIHWKSPRLFFQVHAFCGIKTAREWCAEN